MGGRMRDAYNCEDMLQHPFRRDLAVVFEETAGYGVDFGEFGVVPGDGSVVFPGLAFGLERWCFWLFFYSIAGLGTVCQSIWLLSYFLIHDFAQKLWRHIGPVRNIRRGKQIVRLTLKMIKGRWKRCSSRHCSSFGRCAEAFGKRFLVVKAGL